MRKMYVNATQPEETRIAITKDQDKLIDLDIENIDYEQKKGNIYKAKISRIEPSLNAVFVNYGEQKNGFLPYKEISPEYFKKAPVDNKDNQTPLNELLDENQELIVQINKEERGTKGAALTTYITLAGCYVVLMPNNSEAGGISKRVEGENRKKLKSLIESLNCPEHMGLIVRTAGVDHAPSEIQWDLDVLLNLWNAILAEINNFKAPLLLHRENDIMIRAIRDYLRDDVASITVDTKEAYDDIKRQLHLLRPDFEEKLHLYEGQTPLFSHIGLESQIETAYLREVKLASGGSIVIDATEALTAVDINSAKATRRDNIEDTATHTNLEAAEEIARQMKLRDIGGLLIIDFIDMHQEKNQKSVEEKLAQELQNDRAKIQLSRISKFGLVEISRQRLKPSLEESTAISCPRCEGRGAIRPISSVGLVILRLIEEEATKEKTNEIRVQLPNSVATFLTNEKRQTIYELESRLDLKIVLIPNPNLETPHYYIQRIYGDNYTAVKESFDLLEDQKAPVEESISPSSKQSAQKPAVKTIQSQARETQKKDMAKQNEKSNESNKQKTDVISRLSKWFAQLKTKISTPSADQTTTQKPNAQSQSQTRDLSKSSTTGSSTGQSGASKSGYNAKQTPKNKSTANAKTNQSPASSKPASSSKKPEQSRSKSSANQPSAKKGGPTKPQKNQSQSGSVKKAQTQKPSSNVKFTQGRNEIIDLEQYKNTGSDKQKANEAKANEPINNERVANADHAKQSVTKTNATEAPVKPEDKISPMVNEVLRRCQSNAHKIQQVETKQKASAKPAKYIEEKIIELNLDQEQLAPEADQSESSAHTKAKSGASKKDKASKQSQNDQTPKQTETAGSANEKQHDQTSKAQPQETQKPSSGQDYYNPAITPEDQHFQWEPVEQSQAEPTATDVDTTRAYSETEKDSTSEASIQQEPIVTPQAEDPIIVIDHENEKTQLNDSDSIETKAYENHQNDSSRKDDEKDQEKAPSSGAQSTDEKIKND